MRKNQKTVEQEDDIKAIIIVYDVGTKQSFTNQLSNHLLREMGKFELMFIRLFKVIT